MRSPTPHNQYGQCAAFSPRTRVPRALPWAVRGLTKHPASCIDVSYRIHLLNVSSSVD